jgi:hypothetical protein
MELEFLSAGTVAKFIIKVHVYSYGSLELFQPKLQMKYIPLLIVSTSAMLV